MPKKLIIPLISIIIIFIFLISGGLYVYSLYQDSLFVAEYNSKTSLLKRSVEKSLPPENTKEKDIDLGKTLANLKSAPVIAKIDASKFDPKFSSISNSFNEAIDDTNNYYKEFGQVLTTLKCAGGEGANLDKILNTAKVQSEAFNQNETDDIKLIAYFESMKSVFEEASKSDQKLNRCVNFTTPSNPYSLLATEFKNVADGIVAKDVKKIETATKNIKIASPNQSPQMYSETKIALEKLTKNFETKTKELEVKLLKIDQKHKEELEKLDLKIEGR